MLLQTECSKKKSEPFKPVEDKAKDEEEDAEIAKLIQFKESSQFS